MAIQVYKTSCHIWYIIIVHRIESATRQKKALLSVLIWHYRPLPMYSTYDPKVKSRNKYSLSCEIPSEMEKVDTRAVNTIFVDLQNEVSMGRRQEKEIR